MKDREIPETSTHDVSTFDIIIDGQVIDQAYQVMSISVGKEINKIPTARIVLRDGDAAEETFQISEQENFIPGKSIAIKIGKDRDNEQVFQGLIIKHGIKIKENGETQLTLDCRDAAVKMTLGRHNFYYEERTDSEIMEEIISRYQNLSSNVQSTSITHLEMVQYHVTDWDFMLMRAEANAQLVFVNDGEINIAPPQTNNEPEIGVLYGSTLIDFEAEMDGRNQWKSVEAKSWDYGGQDMFESSTESVNIDELGNVAGQTLANEFSPEKFELRHSGQVIAEELENWATSTLQISRLSKIRGRAKFRGYTPIKPGHMIDLQGLGTRFTGKAFVSGVKQIVQNGSWQTQVQFGLSPECFAKKYHDIISPPAGGLIPAIQGLQIGKVVQLQDDPEGENRILVRLPIVDNSAPGIWARIATLDAGVAADGVAGRGSFFLPEIEDEVIVGFINDDPREAIVLGMLHSSTKPAPYEAQDTNFEKGFTTKSGMRLLFNDETKTIIVDTPAGNSIILDEDTTSITVTDQNDNVLKMESSGIQMNSPGDITIEASGNLNLKAGMDVATQGVNIAMQAQATMEIKGASTSVSADGITEVKGSIVNIN
ncbi:type VI secretion system tip protein VgrG [Aquimarina agarivorans]|uniref:type VI secretion system tip protein VgrG n=1 Tax=Aquimarina agarivorans TaxID=980584 RepID=UPI000248EFED|nr:type VI secretion system tip protein VgrG [Aquimarina agarivorans]